MRRYVSAATPRWQEHHKPRCAARAVLFRCRCCPWCPRYPGRLVVLGGHWTGSMAEGLLVGFHALGVRTAGSGLADLLGALFNERLAFSDAKIDLGEEHLLQVNSQPREDFVPDS
ncbi:MAG: hypothetical protein EOO37_02220 [Cytophagaceae bacterium]|nr:MAG: hypothetical protein EOO37_02220 [Cytophagaceae bacterium]